MAALFRQAQRHFHRSPSPARIAKSISFTTLDSGVKIEEENMPAYERGLFYPVRIGEVFHARYQVLSKLGFGANSTVWFCRDLEKHEYAALKVYIHSSRAHREVKVLNHLASIKAQHPGKALVRTMHDAFVINGPAGDHQCLVHEPLLISLMHIQAIFPEKSLTEDMLKQALQHILITLDYLHSKACVIHTDIQAKNLILGTSDKSVFADFDTAEEEDPSPRKANGDHIIYQSRQFRAKKGWGGWGLPVLCDFGEARVGEQHEGLIQPDLYRAPEVMLGMKWDSKVDIWNVGVMIWDLFEDHHMLDGRDPEKKHSDAHLLAEMIAFLGPPPLKFLRRSQASSKYWDETGNWKGLAKIPDYSLEDSEEYLEGRNKELFLQFTRKMLVWDPEERCDARDLLDDEWLNSPDT